MVLSASVNGDSPDRTVFQGVTDTMRNTEPRRTSGCARSPAMPMRAMARPGCADSAAAMVVISAPVMAKNTVGTAASTAIQPCGVKPP